MTHTQKKVAHKKQQDITEGSPIVSRVSFTLGLLAVLLILNPLAYLLGVFAVILGLTSLKTSNRRTAIAGVVMGISAILLASLIRLSI